ncbi:MAG TPA: hypothetical protein VGK96_08480 [Candidatus Sulfotelmatobacter sp.]|jgi:hypothetical protein
MRWLYTLASRPSDFKQRFNVLDGIHLLNGVSTDDLLGVVAEASNKIHTSSKGQALVFDDFNLNDDWRPLEPCFRDLGLAIREAQGSLVFASYTPLPQAMGLFAE